MNDDYEIDPLVITPPPTSERLDANLANCIAGQLELDAEFMEEFAREELGGRLL